VRLADVSLLSLVSVGRHKPIWIGKQGLNELLNYWDNDKFKENSSWNKISISSSQCEHYTL